MLSAALVDFVWNEWAQMGVFADRRHQSRWAQDPEALILFTLEVGRSDARLFDEVLDWIVTNESLLSVRRLRASLRTTKIAAVSDYIASSQIRDLLEELRPTLAHAGIPVSWSPSPDSAWADLTETTNLGLSHLAIAPLGQRAAGGTTK